MTSPFSADSALAAIAAQRQGRPASSPIKDAAFDAVSKAVEPLAAKGAEGALAAVTKAWSLAEEMWAKIRATPAFALGAPKVACGRGCGWCCHQRVGAAAVEVLHIAERIRNHPDRDGLLARLAGWPTGRTCAFLADGACTIYDMRPLKCRGVYQVDARWCMTTYAKMDLPLFGPAPDHRYQTEPKDVFDGAVFGLALPFHKAGLDCAGVDFIPALKAVVNRPDAALAWSRGETVFPPEARLHDWFPPMARPAKAKGRGR